MLFQLKKTLKWAPHSYTFPTNMAFEIVINMTWKINSKDHRIYDQALQNTLLSILHFELHQHSRCISSYKKPSQLKKSSVKYLWGFLELFVRFHFLKLILVLILAKKQVCQSWLCWHSGGYGIDRWWWKLHLLGCALLQKFCAFAIFSKLTSIDEKC